MAKLLILSLVFGLGVFARDLDKTYQKAEFQLGSHKLKAYIADDDQKRTKGLMFVERLERDTGMLFVFPTERTLSFWMKNTRIPLSIGFFNRKGVLVDLQDMEVPTVLLKDDPPIYTSRKSAQYALEMPKGWFKEKKIPLGARLRLLAGPGPDELRELRQ